MCMQLGLYFRGAGIALTLQLIIVPAMHIFVYLNNVIRLKAHYSSGKLFCCRLSHQWNKHICIASSLHRNKVVAVGGGRWRHWLQLNGNWCNSLWCWGEQVHYDMFRHLLAYRSCPHLKVDCPADSFWEKKIYVYLRALRTYWVHHSWETSKVPW